MPRPKDPLPTSGSDFATILGAARAGDEKALEELFERFYPSVERMVHAGLSRDLRLNRPWLNTRFSTGDVVQEVFRSLLRDLSGFEGSTREAFIGYLALVVRNRLLDAIRFHEAARRDGRRSRDAEEGVNAASSEAGPATGAASSDSIRAMIEILDTFPERDRLLLRGRLEQGVRFADLAEQLGFSSKSAAKRAFYAAQAQLAIRIRKGLSGDGEAS